MRSLISILDFTAEELDRLIDTAMDIIENPEEYSQKCRGKKLATLFFETVHKNKTQLRGRHV